MKKEVGGEKGERGGGEEKVIAKERVEVKKEQEEEIKK